MFLPILILFTRSERLDRYSMDSMFLKLLDDQTMREAVKKEKRSFVFFHADHLRLSDNAYARYVKVAREFKQKASFFVVPATQGADVMRSYDVTSSPSLLYFFKGTKVGYHVGMFSEDSIRRFISNWTSESLQLQFSENATESQIYEGISEALPNRRLTMVVFGDGESSKFERSMNDLINELGNFFPFVRINDKKVAEKVGVRFPSLMLIRFEDLQKFVYNGEPDVDEMFIWAQHHSIPPFRALDTTNLFSLDGVSVRSAIAFLDNNDDEQVDHVYPFLGSLSAKQDWIRLFYADKNIQTSMTKLFGIEKFPQILYLSANYTHCSYHIGEIGDNETFQSFYEEKLPLKTIQTPPSMYGTLRPVTEFSFEKLMEEGPFFTLFTSAFCTKCKTLKRAGIDAAKTIAKNNGKTKWAFWDVTKSSPSFQSNISLGIPSIWYFPTNNLTEGVLYAGPSNYLSIVEWVNGLEPESFDLDKIMTKEIGGGFDEI